MDDKAYKQLVKKIYEDLKPAISKYIKTTTKKQLKETLETLKDFNFLTENRVAKRINEDSYELPSNYNNMDKTKQMVKNTHNFGGVTVEMDEPVKEQKQAVDPSKLHLTNYSNFMEQVEKADKLKQV